MTARDLPAPETGELLAQYARNAILAVLAMLAWIGTTFAAGVALLRRRDLH